MVQAAWRALRVRAELMRQRRAAIHIQVTSYRTTRRSTACASVPASRQAVQSKPVL